jgi:hypothetical protein
VEQFGPCGFSGGLGGLTACGHGWIGQGDGSRRRRSSVQKGQVLSVV